VLRQAGEPCGSPTKARPLKYRRAEVDALSPGRECGRNKQAVKPGHWVYPSDFAIIREGSYLGFRLEG